MTFPEHELDHDSSGSRLCSSGWSDLETLGSTPAMLRQLCDRAKTLFPQLDVSAALAKIEDRLSASDANHLLMLGALNRLQESVDQLAMRIQSLVAEFQTPVQ